MYAPVYRQIDTPFQQACPQAGPSAGTAGPACLHTAHHRQASLAQVATAHPTDFGSPIMDGASLAVASTSLLVLVLLVTAVAIAFLSNGRRAASAASPARDFDMNGAAFPLRTIDRDRE